MLLTATSEFQPLSCSPLSTNPSRFRGICVHQTIQISPAATAKSAALRCPLSLRRTPSSTTVRRSGNVRRMELMAAGRRGMMALMFAGFSIHNSFSISASADDGGSPTTEEEVFVKKTISSHDIVIFSKTYCPYCQMAKAVFKELDKVPYVIELDEREDGFDIQKSLSGFVGRRTVPQVFVKGKHIGGSDDTIDAYESGNLAKLLGANSRDV